MALNKLVNVYSLDTSAFYTDYERDLAYLTSKLNKRREWLITKTAWIKRKMRKDEMSAGLFKLRLSLLWKFENELDELTARINKLKIESKKLLVESLETRDTRSSRLLRKESLRPQNVISIFDSALTRMLGMKSGDVAYEDLVIVRTYYFQILKDLIVDGFIHNGEKYILLTASAGQIRTKKAVFIKESLFNKHEKTIMCGLSMEEVNRRGGMNINKYMAYMALISSATDTWEEFDIDKSIVVDDFETRHNDWVDYIDYENYTIERKKMDVIIPHTDGVGIMLDKKTTMVRLPFVKGLMVHMPFDKFIKEKKKDGYKKCNKIKDIYGVEHDVIKEKIRYIFTKSQFKLWKYYDSWEQYKEYFKKYQCEACKCNKEEDEFSNARINYQMLQTLTDITDDEILELCKETQKEITDIAVDRKHMLAAFGVEERKECNGNSLQKALSIYPELLQDIHCRETLKQTKASLVKQAKSGRIRIDGTYTFVSPDTYAFCEWLFLGIEDPKGLLNTGEVYCDLFEDDVKLDCLRSPQLSLEHAIRINKLKDECKKWFKTHCIYTANKDMISKILQFDVDGDKLLVVKNKLLIDIAERNIRKYDVVPLYYDMKKANAEILSNETLYSGMTKAYTGGNIGVISNDISKMWNSFTDDFEFNKETLKAVKLMCMENNFTIDYAKTLFKPTRPPEIDDLIKRYTRLKVPYFFKYAKDKSEEQVEPVNRSTVNRFDTLIDNPKFRWSATNVGKFDYKMLMKNKEIEVDDQIIERYKELNKIKNRLFNEERDRKKKEHFIDKYIRNELLKINKDVECLTDVLVKYLYITKAQNKTTLWNSFGDIIIKNLQTNIPANTKLCEVCGERFEFEHKVGKPEIYCSKCKKTIELEKTRNRVKKYRENN